MLFVFTTKKKGFGSVVVQIPRRCEEDKTKGYNTSGIYMNELHNSYASNSQVLYTWCGTHICTLWVNGK